MRTYYSLNFKRLVTSFYIPMYLGIIISFVSWDFSLPATVDDWKPYDFLFGFPHIFTSLFIVGNQVQIIGKGVMNYRVSLFIYVLLPIALFFISNQIYLVLIIFLLVRHVLSQQFGIASSFINKNDKLLNFWKIISICCVSVSYSAYLMGQSDIHFDLFDFNIHNALFTFLLITSVFVLAKLMVLYRANLAVERIYLLSTIILPVAVVGLLTKQLYFLAIFIPRCAHDLTAFSFYERDGLKKKMIGLYLGFTFISFTLNALFKVYGQITLEALTWLGLLHYYFESFMWKSQKSVERARLITD